MNYAFTQSTIIERLKKVEDPDILEIISALLDSVEEKSNYTLTDNRIQVVEESRVELKNGDFDTQENFFSNARSWLKGK